MPGWSSTTVSSESGSRAMNRTSRTRIVRSLSSFAGFVDHLALEVRIAVEGDADELNRAYRRHSSLRSLRAVRQEGRFLSIEFRLGQHAAFAKRREPLELAGVAAAPRQGR